MTKATRRLTDIKFEHEGAHVALVGKHQGGPANGITTLVTKATDHVSAEETEDALKKLALDPSLTIIEEPSLDTIEKAVHEQLLEKAVADAVAVEKASGVAAVELVQKALDEQAVVLKAAQDLIAEYEAADKAAVEKARKDALADAGVPADKLEAVYKAYSVMDEEGFAVAIEVMKAQKAVADQSDLLNETGVTGVGEGDPAKVDKVAEILKAKFPKTQGVK